MYPVMTVDWSTPMPPAHVQQFQNRIGVEFYVPTGSSELLSSLLDNTFTSGTGSGQYLKSAIVRATIPSAPSEMIGKVRDIFRLNMSQTSKVFRVERPTIYLWASMTDSSKIKSANFERMKTLYIIATECKRNGMLTPDALQWTLDDGTTFLDKISEEKIDAPKIVNAWKLLGNVKEQLLEKRKSRGRNFANAIANSVNSLKDKEKLRREIFGESAAGATVEKQV